MKIGVGSEQRFSGFHTFVRGAFVSRALDSPLPRFERAQWATIAEMLAQELAEQPLVSSRISPWQGRRPSAVEPGP